MTKTNTRRGEERGEIWEILRKHLLVNGKFGAFFFVGHSDLLNDSRGCIGAEGDHSRILPLKVGKISGKLIITLGNVRGRFELHFNNEDFRGTLNVDQSGKERIEKGL